MGLVSFFNFEHILSAKKGWSSREVHAQSYKQNDLIKVLNETFPANIYLFKDNNRNTTKRCEICSKLKKMTPERGH